MKNEARCGWIVHTLILAQDTIPKSAQSDRGNRQHSNLECERPVRNRGITTPDEVT